jgi:Tol biopolymer transport system component
VLEGAQALRYLSSGYLAYFYRGNLMAIRFNPYRGKTVGDSVVAVENVSREGWTGVQAALSDTGTLAYVSGLSISNRTLSWIDKGSKETPLAMPPGSYEPLDISPDGRRLLVSKLEGSGTNWSLWMLELGTGRWTRLADGARIRSGALWSRDGNSIIFASDHFSGQMLNLCRMPADGSRPPQPLGPLNPAFDQYPTSIAPDGSIAFSEGTLAAGSSEIRVLRPGATQSVVAIGGPGWKLQPAFSPDGHWLAYTSDVSGTRRIYLQPYPESGNAVVVSPESGFSPVWSRDGRSLIYLSYKGIMRVPVSLRPRLTVGQPVLFAPRRFEQSSLWLRGFLLAPDGRILIVKNPQAEQRLKQIHVILNWGQELQGMLP